MKALILLSLLSIPALESNVKSGMVVSSETASSKTVLLNGQPDDSFGRMSATIFKNQEYCRVELKDFEFDVKFSVVSATVYFSGANFRGVEKGVINSSSLKPLSALMSRCIPGSMVVFDDVKVKGPDNEIRSIPGVAYRLF